MPSPGFLIPLTGLSFEEQLHIRWLSITCLPLYLMLVQWISYCCGTGLLDLYCGIMLGNNDMRFASFESFYPDQLILFLIHRKSDQLILV